MLFDCNTKIGFDYYLQIARHDTNQECIGKYLKEIIF